MKFSKSILSPGRARDGPLSLPTSLSRRLRANGSIKGGHGQGSPMFPTTAGKKRGSGFENPEPTSPKVTCIGQVRVKTKKKVKQTRSLSKRRSGSGEVSFRKIEQVTEAFNQTDDRLLLRNQRYSQGNSSVHYQQQECVSHRNQRWVHLPLTICEALRAFGAEFSCLFPCKSSCFSTNEREKEEKGYREGEHNEQRWCGAVFARWLVAVQDGEGGKRRDIELVVASGGEEERRSEAAKCGTMRSSRRHVFEDIEFNDEMEGGDNEGKGRVSICIPPKNALLLMRCRSDPLKMADLTNRFRESSTVAKDEDFDEDEEEEEELEKFGENKHIEVVDFEKFEHREEIEATEKRCKMPAETSISVDLDEIEENPEEIEVMEIEEEQQKHETCELAAEIEQEVAKIVSFVAEVESLEEVNRTEDNEEIEDNQVRDTEEEGEEKLANSSNLSHSSLSDNSDIESIRIEDEELELVTEEAALEDKDEEEERFKSIIMKDIEEILMLENTEMNPTMSQQQSEQEEQMPEQNAEGKQIEQSEEPDNEEKESVLPECLLLMMCEPKLSMEVSKETWVCRRDFLRWLPERKQVKQSKKEFPEEQPKRRRSTDTKPGEHRSKHMLQPPRSSCSLPAAAGMSMATMIEQKLVNAAAYEPFVLTRCKSEPMRTAAAKLTPENCCWKNRKIEPHRPATFGAAGVGF